MKKLNLKSRRGFSLAEVVVALAVIVIVTGAALLLVNSHTKLQVRTAQNISAANTVENAIECFRFAANEDDFKEVFFVDVLGMEKPDATGSYTFENDGLGYEITVSGKKITVMVSPLQIEQSFTKK